MKTNILSNMNSVMKSFAKRVMMVIAVVMTASSAWGAEGDEVTAVGSIVSGKWYYIKGVRDNGTVEYLTFSDAIGTNVNGTSSSTTSGAVPLLFTYESSKWYITTPKGYYLYPGTSNSKLNITSTKTDVHLSNSGSLIAIQDNGNSYYIQKNKSGTNFGSYSSGQNNITLIEGAEYTISWSVNGGSCSGSPSTKVLSGHKVTVLPTPPTTSDCDNSKVFVGWSASQIDGSTNTRPSDLFTYPNAAPVVTKDITYYAVFATQSNASTLLSEDFAGCSSGNSTSTSGSGTAWARNDNFYTGSNTNQAGGAVRLGTSSSIGYLTTKELSASSGKVLSIAFKVKGWDPIEGNIAITPNSSEFTTPNEVTYSQAMGGSFEDAIVYVVLTKNNPKIKIATTTKRAFLDDLVITSADYSEYVTTCCDKIVALSKGTETNATISSFSPSRVPTCSATDADRNVTITVAAATGYEFTSSARLSYSGDGTATYVSGPTGTGPYTYVYVFDQNDNGTGTFSATATAKTYTIDLNGNEGTGHTSSVTATYNSSSLSSSITNPQRAGYTFDGWYSGSGGTGTLIISTSGVLQANVSTYTGAGGIWTKDDGTTLYAKWTPKNYKLTVGTPNNVTISATPDGKSEITEGNSDAAVPCGTTIALSAVVDDGYSQAGWKITKDEDESDVTEDYPVVDGEMSMPPFDATVTATMYSDFVFSCAELTLTPVLATAGTPIFITSTASKTVRSQDKIEITGSGLTPSTELTFPGLPSKFEILTATGGALATNSSGVIEEDAYIFYTPGSGDTSDGLDKITGITVSVDGAKPITKKLTQDIIGRHLPAEFVIAGKKDNKWYALPSNMASTGTPAPSEIAVNDINNPSIAYTAASNIYGLAGPTASNISGGNGQYVRLTMSIDDGNDPAGPAPLYGSGEAQIGKSGKSKATSDLSAGWWWALTQKNTSISNPQDAKYRLTCPNNGNTLSIKNSPFAWGQYASGVEELRLIPASSIVFAEAEVVEWGQHAAIIEVNATAATGVDATSVIAHLNGESSSAITLSETKTSVKGGDTKYNYTVTFGDGIDFAAATSNGAMLTLEWKKGETVKAMSNIIVPKIIASSATMSSLMATDDPWSKAEVHILPGVTLTANAGDFESKDVVIDRLEIYPGATVTVSKGSQDVGTLKVRTLVLRNGWTRVGSKRYDVARLYVPTDANLAKNAVDNVWYSDWYIDYDQYYPIAVPFPVATSGISYKNTSTAANLGVKLRYYSGELRATNVQQNQDANWVEYTWGGTMPANLEPSKGYIMTAKRPTGKAFSIVRMPMTFTNDWTTGGEKGVVSGTHKDQVEVTAWGDANTPSYAKGWNIIANPYMALHKGALSYNDASGDAIEYANIPDISFKEYDQLPILTTKLKPASAFLVQAPKTGTVTFGATARVVSAPSYKTESTPVSSKQKAYIELSNEEANDMMGLIISDQYTAEYEINADLEKLLGDGTSLKTYMRYDDRNMAYLAINKVLAQEWIPVSVRLPQTGEYTFSLHEASVAGELEGVYLIDYTSNEVTNLIENSYTFVAESGTISNRFAINATVGERQTPTAIDVIGADKNGDRPIKFLYRDKVYIWHRGVIYDATGKKVREINK